MLVKLTDASGHRAAVTNLNQLYLYDFVEFADDDVNREGLYTSSYLDAYWSDEDRHPFLICVDDALAGFALVRRDAEGGHSIAEFFVMRKYRRNGIGERAAAEAYARFPGRWTVHQMASNPGAQAFWRKTIGRYTGGRFTETEHPGQWPGTSQSFDNSTW